MILGDNYTTDHRKCHQLQTALAQVLDELERNRKKENHLKYNFQDDGNIVSCQVVHVSLQEGCNPTSKFAKSRRFGVKIRVISVFGMYNRVSQKIKKSEFWNGLYPSGFQRLDEPPEKISAL